MVVCVIGYVSACLYVCLCVIVYIAGRMFVCLSRCMSRVVFACLFGLVNLCVLI